MEFVKEIAPYVLILALLIAAIGILYDGVTHGNKLLRKEREMRDLLIGEVNKKLAFPTGIHISFETFNDTEAIAITYFDQEGIKRHTEHIFAKYTTAEGDPEIVPNWAM